MTNQFSNMMKSLRRKRNLTQEQIAEALGVSGQAVSKWETGTSYPDISLLPVLADYFGVSVDCLLGHDMTKQTEEIENVLAQADQMFSESRYVAAVPLLREALVKHPGNEKLMYHLAWALSGTLSEAKDYDSYEEAILLYHRILDISTDTAMRTKVTRDLIYRYATKEDYDKAMFFADQLPSFAFCKEHILGRANILTGRALSEYLQSNIRLFGSALLECLEYFDCEKILTAEEKLPYTTESAKESIGLIQKILDCSR